MMAYLNDGTAISASYVEGVDRRWRQSRDRRVLNAMTVDVEDYFQVSAFEDRVSRANWDGFESRVCRNTERLLEIFAAEGVTCTFFVLGWIAERFPKLVRQIHAAGH